ncbi:TraR/DksA family transcriptional regulator [Aeoliella mucimassa]|uniref:RNA polymerase-binding transcription factor n=1 Tax=Aeoliella mucimassa TaxID=2527972 RepID=A0A518ANQ5_9BACT|nr:TraR/DksA family transcriptional regulator [Aeoliella mucimassa]QDU56348.1 RNA polymerase-binding transcription factor [Aeoliella mucimassa]
MKKADMQVYKQRLLALRARLRGDVSAMADAALRKSGLEGDNSSMPIHMAELGSENYEQEFTLSLVATEEDTLQQIDAAISRVDQGTFGKCVECDGVIPKTRLNAIPFAPMCIKCAEKFES